MVYTVGEIAKKMNVAASTIRYYDKEGLLPFVERSEGGIRMFRDEDMEWLLIIDCLKNTGMPIKEIKHFIDCCVEGDSRIDDRLHIIRNQRDRVIKEIENLKKRLEMLNFKTWYYEEAQRRGTALFYKTVTPEESQKNITLILKKNGKKIQKLLKQVRNQSNLICHNAKRRYNLSVIPP